MSGMGKNAAGRMADRKCEKVGMRLTMEPVVCCGKSDARAIGKKAARKEREGAAEIAVLVVYIAIGMVALTFTISRSEPLQLPSQRARDEMSSFGHSRTGGERHVGTPLAWPP
jgi:hypothetical protein